MQTKVLFNEDWIFQKQALIDQNMEQPVGFDGFEPVDLPHDWLIYDSLDLYEDSIGWYRKQLVLQPENGEEVLLRFEGVYMDSTVFINGNFAGEWKYGYSTFEVAIACWLDQPVNEILVRVVHQAPNSRWYSGAGIYRDVWLIRRGTTRVESDGIYISTKKGARDWTVEIETEFQCSESIEIRHRLYDGAILVGETQSSWRNIGAGVDTQGLNICRPKLWDIDKPHCYTLKTELIGASDVVDRVETGFGFRTIKFSPDHGFFLNERHLKLNGVCEHHDLGCLGAAFNKAAMRRRLKILKEMGVNAIRTAHNMPAVGLMELADEMGMLIVSEAFDMWERSKTAYDYARFFKEWAYHDVRSWVRRDRNHPSLILWSIGNEIYDTHADERGQEITRMLMAYVHKFDPKGNAAVTIGSNYMPWENAQKCAEIVKMAGYNYAEKYYEPHHKEHPDWVIYGSETASIVQSRGIYHFPFKQSLLADDDEQCSALGNSTTSWGAKSTEACILKERDTSYSMGQFIWTGFDYIGEPTPYHTKNSYFGQLDTAGFKKDSYYIYQAEWTDVEKHPMVHLLPYWDFNPGQIVDVRACTNGSAVSLYLNSRLIGTHEIDHEFGNELLGLWQVPYEPGELKAVAYDRSGNIIATAIRHSFTDSAAITLTTDRKVIYADGRDMVFVEIMMKDEKGHLVENANNRVVVEVTGAGRLVGLDNGDSTDYDSYKGVSRRLFSGKLLAAVAARTQPGEIRIQVSSEGIKSAQLILPALEVEDPAFLDGIRAEMENKAAQAVVGVSQESPYWMSEADIPVRKVEIRGAGPCLLTPEHPSHVLNTSIFPKNASDQTVFWSVVNDAGIPSNIATIEACGHEAIVRGIGDGHLRVRCQSRSGTGKIRLISQVEFEVQGMGAAYKDPYEFISAGLYDWSRGDISNGNERGIATSRDGITMVGFSGIDFGDFGSDRITIPIFALSGNPYEIQIWSGMAGEEGSTCLAEAVYQKQSKWNTYQEETFVLDRRLKGIGSLSFVLKDKVHIKGFVFEKSAKAFSKLMATACDEIYGDTYKIEGDTVEEIGNNVSLIYEGMDFGQGGACRIRLCGHSPIDKNTIQIRCSNGEDETVQILEFAYNTDFEEKVMELTPIYGYQQITFIFLPGSRFNFKYFKFE